jgi:hypothetical protein
MASAKSRLLSAQLDYVKRFAGTMKEATAANTSLIEFRTPESWRTMLVEGRGNEIKW